jgi:hypothetical protein
MGAVQSWQKGLICKGQEEANDRLSEYYVLKVYLALREVYRPHIFGIPLENDMIQTSHKLTFSNKNPSSVQSN